MPAEISFMIKTSRLLNREHELTNAPEMPMMEI